MKQFRTYLLLATLLLLLPAAYNRALAAFPLYPATAIIAEDSVQLSAAAALPVPAALQEAQKTTKLERWALRLQSHSKAAQRTALNGFAIGALAGAGIGLLGFFFVEGWILGMGAVAAIVLGIIGISGHRKNKGLAWAALILGTLELLFLIAVLLLLATL